MVLNLYFLVPIVSGAGDAQSLLSRVVSLLIIVSFCTCYFGHCVVCPSFIYASGYSLGIFKLLFLSILFFYIVFNLLHIELWAHESSLTPSLFIEEPLPTICSRQCGIFLSFECKIVYKRFYFILYNQYQSLFL